MGVFPICMTTEQSSFAVRTHHLRKMLSVPLLHFQNMIPRGWNCIFKKSVSCPWTAAEKYPSLLPLRKHERLSPFSAFVSEKAGTRHCCCCYSVLGWMVAFFRIERFMCMKLYVSHEGNGRREQDKGIHAIWKWYLFLMHSESEPASSQINWKNTCSCEQKINLVMTNLT